MASTKNRGRTVREAVLKYCTFQTQTAYLLCWPKLHEVYPEATAEEKKEALLVVACEMMPMLRHEVPASEPEPEPMREPAVLRTGDLDSDSGPDIMAGSFLGTYGQLDIDTAGHWTYRADEPRLRDLKENGPDWLVHYDRFFVTHEDGSVQTLTITLFRYLNDEVKETKALPTVGDRVPAETFGENNEPDLGLATARDLNRKLPDPDQFDGPAPVPLWVEGKPDDGMPRREATQDELRHLRLYLEPDELSGGGLKFEGLLFFNAAERLPVDETTGSDKAAVDQEEHAESHVDPAEEIGPVRYKRWADNIHQLRQSGEAETLKAAAMVIAGQEGVDVSYVIREERRIRKEREEIRGK